MNIDKTDEEVVLKSLLYKGIKLNTGYSEDEVPFYIRNSRL